MPRFVPGAVGGLLPLLLLLLFCPDGACAAALLGADEAGAGSAILAVWLRSDGWVGRLID